MAAGLIAAGTLAFNAAKAIKGRIDEKNADKEGASLQDPRQRAIVNAMHRRKRALETGTANNGARSKFGQNLKMALTKGIKGGGRSGAVFQGLKNAAEQSLTDSTAAERGGLMAQLYKGESDLADRKMDKLDLKAQTKRLQGTANKDTGQKNAMVAFDALKNAAIS